MKDTFGARLLRVVPLAGLIVLLDQLTKFWVVRTIAPGKPVQVIPHFFDLVYVLNRGAAFGFLNSSDISWQRYFFIGIKILAVFVILFIVKLSKTAGPFFLAGLGLILGGAVGNLVDRLHTGLVVDFLDVYVGAYHWPAFNVADSAITVGAGLLIIALYRQDARK